MFLAEDIMTKDVVITTPDASVKGVAQKMNSKQISCIIVSDKKKPIGIISERDFIRKVFAKDAKKGMKAKDIMSTPVLSISPRETVNNAARLMRENKIRHMLVTNENKVKGVITETDVLSGETEYVRAHQFLQNLILALFITILLLFVMVFRVF
ncbi:MAG: cyclic nucleotide-binding/CBS domain-containing protein [Nanoarchaeota archaeon]